MSKEISFFIVKLDEGYILTDKNKTKALEFSKNVEDYLVQRFLKEIERFAHTGVYNMQINISIEENIPQCADR